MLKQPALIVLSCLLVAGAIDAGRKPAPKQSADPKLQDEEILHVLNRLSFGPRAVDLETVKQLGLDTSIDRQLHPETIPESAELEARLQPLDSLQMTTPELLRNYPGPQVVKATGSGQVGLPSDPTMRVAVRAAIERRRESKGQQPSQGAASADLSTVLTSLPLTDQQRDSLLNGNPPARIAVLQRLTDEQLLSVLQAIPRAQRAKLAQFAPAVIRRKIDVLNTPFQLVARDLTEGKLLRAVYSNRQLQEVLTDFWFNHFNVYLDKGPDRSLVTSYERDVIRPGVFGKFRDLLLATAQSPAMLFYLDNWQSVGADTRVNSKGKRRAGLNENYARELLELHTLGVDGGYTQTDVTEVARCFTGWTILQPRVRGEFQFNQRLHDKGEKHVLGVAIPAGGGMEDGIKVIEMLARRPATAHFISKQLAMRFVADDPPEPLVSRMAATFLSSDGDLRQVMRTMIFSPEFRDRASFRLKLKSPLELVVSAIRAVNGDLQNATALSGLLNQMGEPLYRKQEPTGYSNRGGDWLNSASLLARMNFAGALAKDRVPGVRVDTGQFTGEPAGIERRILFCEPSRDAGNAIEAGLDQQVAVTASRGVLAAGLTLGSPDFQRH